jgi:hypothetical protein
MMSENVDSPNLISSDIGSISGTSPPKTTLISPSNNMNAAEIPSRGAAGIIASRVGVIISHESRHAQ